MSRPLSDLRKNYAAGELDESTIGEDPLALFRQWLDEALARSDKDVPEPSAMTLATVGPQGRPSTRIVLLKDAGPSGFVWFTNYHSRKGRELQANPQAALQFHWVALERVVRIEGRVEQVDASESDTYFRSRPLASRIGAWASEQSTTIGSRATLVARAAEYGLKFGLNPPRPPHWGGYRLAPDRYEFWQGRASRLHDRIRFELAADARWRRERLAP